MAAYAWKGDRGTFFYLALAWIAVAAAATGFSTTYFIPVAAARFNGPAAAHVHGLLFLSWLALLVIQTVLMKRGSAKLHRKLGLAALPLAAAMAASGAAVGVHAVARDLAAGLGDLAYSQLIGVLTTMLIFVLYVAIAVAMRKRPDWHKRMMLLATIAVLWPAWFRFRHLMPWLPRPDILLAIVVSDSLIAVAIVRDRLKFGRVHPAYLIFGLALIAEHVAEALLFDTPPWRAAARWAYSAVVGAA